MFVIDCERSIDITEHASISVDINCILICEYNFQFEWLLESSDMTRSQGIGLAIFIFYTLAATITIVTVILSTSKTESNDDTFSPNETMTISKDDNENSTNILVPVVTIPHNWAKEDSDINNDFTDSTTYSATITSTPLSTTTTAATSTTTTTATASTLSTTTIPTSKTYKILIYILLIYLPTYFSLKPM